MPLATQKKFVCWSVCSVVGHNERVALVASKCIVCGRIAAKHAKSLQARRGIFLEVVSLWTGSRTTQWAAKGRQRRSWAVVEQVKRTV